MWLASFGKFNSLGTKLNPLFLFSEQSGKKGGGDLGLPSNQLVLADLDLWGHLILGQIWACQFCSFYEFTHVPSSLPTFQAVVIQQLSIG